MLPDLYAHLMDGKEMELSSCRQNWDYLDVYDAADAFISLAERGGNGEIYNVANGDYRPLIEYTEMLKKMIAPEVNISYGKDPEPFVSLQPSIEKIKEDTGWTPKKSFEDSVKDYV